MDLPQFQILSEDERYILWLAFSVEVASYEACGFRFILFQLDNFYIEVQLLKILPERIILNPFSDDDCLRPYLERINISEIFLSDKN